MAPKKKIFRDSDSEPEDIESEEATVESDDADDLVRESDDNDDGAPDDITFVQSKADALMKVKDALANIGKEKERKKEKRRLRDEQFKQQKKKRLGDLSRNRLSDDFLKTIASVPVPAEPEEPAKEDVDDEDLQLNDGASDSDSGFIPLGGSEVKAVYVNAQSKTAQTAVEQLQAFRDKLLYGGKIRRLPEHARQALAAKRKARFR